MQTKQLLYPAASLSVDVLSVYCLLPSSNSPPIASEFPLGVDSFWSTSDDHQQGHAPIKMSKNKRSLIILRAIVSCKHKFEQCFDPSH